MAIASEILNTTFVAEAEVVTSDSTVMYNDPLLQDLKQITVEELYEKLDQELTEKFSDKTPPEDCLQILGYLSELYRRGIRIYDYSKNSLLYTPGMYKTASVYTSDKYKRPMVEIEWWDYDVFICENCQIKKDYTRCVCNPSKEVQKKAINELFTKMLSIIKCSVSKELESIKKIKSIQLASLKKPIVYEDINDLMDAILDANGNKISEFKDYLSPEHYRIIRAGRDVSEIKEQDELLRCLRIMNSQIKK